MTQEIVQLQNLVLLIVISLLIVVILVHYHRSLWYVPCYNVTVNNVIAINGTGES